jgi:hypothetical protein
MTIKLVSTIKKGAQGAFFKLYGNYKLVNIPPNFYVHFVYVAYGK